MIRLLTSYRSPSATTNPYIVQLDRALRNEPGLAVQNFSFARALLGRYDVFHVHWPETLFNARSRFRRTLKQLAMALLLLRLDLTRTAVVFTAHNLGNHEKLDPLGARLVEALRGRAVLHIRLNGADAAGVPEPSEVILHGHYRDWYLRHPQGPAEPGHVVFFGLVRPYKGVEELVAAFRDVVTPGARLTVAGRPLDEQTRSLLEGLAAGDPRVRLDLRFLDEPDLVALVSSAELVALPYREMYNSGSLLAALSLDRPVLVPRSAVNELVEREVGPGWVNLYDGPISAALIDEALGRLRSAPPPTRPDLRSREWAVTGARHLAAYRRARDLRAR